MKLNYQSAFRFQKSFTLVELLVAVAIFSLIVGAATGVFVSAIRAQRKSLAYQEILSQASYAMEYMSRALRMAKKDLDGNCIEAKLNYQKTTTGIKFENYQGICQEFYLEGNQLKENKGGNISELTSDNLKVKSFNIGPSDSWDQDDNDQPRVTLFLTIEGKEKSEIKIQTTISQRNLDVKY